MTSDCIDSSDNPSAQVPSGTVATARWEVFQRNVLTPNNPNNAVFWCDACPCIFVPMDQGEYVYPDRFVLAADAQHFCLCHEYENPLA